MKLLTSAAFGAAALAMALAGSVQPAAARTAFGVYVGGPGYYGYDYRYRCDDYWFRRAHPYRCGYGYDGYYDEDYYDDGYYGPNVGFFFGGGGHGHGHFRHFGHGRFGGHWGGHRGHHH